MNAINLMLDETQNNSIKEQLAAGETVSWVGQEPRSRYISHRIVGIVGLSLMALVAGSITVVMLIMNPNIFQGSLKSLLPVLIPLVVFGFAVYGLVTTILAFIKGHPDLYVVTNQRAMLIQQGMKMDVKSYGPEAIQTMRISRRKNGSGKIIFERIVEWDQDSEGRSRSRVTEIGFFGLPSVDDVCRHLKQVNAPVTTVSLGGDGLPAPERPDVSVPSDFFALETSAFHERLYRVFIISRQVCGARIAGGFSSAGLRSMGQNSGYGFLFSPFANQVANREQKREARYQSISPLGSEFLTADKANFRYGSLDLEHVAVTEEYKTLNNGYNVSGHLELSLHDGKRRKFWLTRNADPAAVSEIFHANGFHVETGESSVHANVR